MRKEGEIRILENKLGGYDEEGWRQTEVLKETKKEYRRDRI